MLILLFNSQFLFKRKKICDDVEVIKKKFHDIFFFLSCTHYSKSQTFVQKFNFDKKPNILTSFSSKFFLAIFLVKSKLSTAKKSKTPTFSRVIQPNFFLTIFLVKSKLSTA